MFASNTGQQLAMSKILIMFASSDHRVDLTLIATLAVFGAVLVQTNASLPPTPSRWPPPPNRAGERNEPWPDKFDFDKEEIKLARCDHNNNGDCGENSFCEMTSLVCKCFFGFAFEHGHCIKVECDSNAVRNPCARFGNAVCSDKDCTCQPGTVENRNTGLCELSHPPAPGNGGTNVPLTIGTSVGSGVLTALVCIAVWRYVKRRRLARMAKISQASNQMLGSGAMGSLGCSSQAPPPPPPAFSTFNSSYYPGPVISVPGQSVLLSHTEHGESSPVQSGSYASTPTTPNYLPVLQHPQSMVGTTPYGSACSTPNLELPPPYTVIDCLTASTSTGAPVVQAAHSSAQLTDQANHLQPSNHFSPVSPAKLALI